MDFDLHKRNIMARADKSRKGSWDDRIAGLCNSINLNQGYCTTSSCSGRVLIIKGNNGRKHDVEYIFVSHNLIEPDDIKDIIRENGDDIVFQAQSAILHVVCRDMACARRLMQKARDCGFRRSGIINDSPYTVEIVSGESLQFPNIFSRDMADDAFMEKLCSASNSILKNAWIKIERLHKEM
jgi:tRNA wybutosine-synthesizing protein 3